MQVFYKRCKIVSAFKALFVIQRTKTLTPLWLAVVSQAYITQERFYTTFLHETEGRGARAEKGGGEQGWGAKKIGIKLKLNWLSLLHFHSRAGSPRKMTWKVRPRSPIRPPHNFRWPMMIAIIYIIYVGIETATAGTKYGYATRKKGWPKKRNWNL